MVVLHPLHKVQKWSCEMKWFGISPLRVTLATCLIAIAITGFYYAGAPYPASPIGRLDRAASVTLRAHGANKSKELEESVERFLPGGWQADLKTGRLWITHYNSNGTVADALLFDSAGSFYDWAAAHPDFCDLDVDRVALAALRAAPTSDDSD